MKIDSKNCLNHKIARLAGISSMSGIYGWIFLEFSYCTLVFRLLLRSWATFPSPSCYKNANISLSPYFFFAWPLCAKRMNMDSSFENSFLKSEVTIFSGKIRLMSLLTKDPWSWMIASYGSYSLMRMFSMSSASFYFWESSIRSIFEGRLYAAKKCGNTHL